MRPRCDLVAASSPGSDWSCCSEDAGATLTPSLPSPTTRPEVAAYLGGSSGNPVPILMAGRDFGALATHRPPAAASPPSSAASQTPPPPAATGALVGAEHGRYSPKTPCCNPLEGGTDGARHTPTSFPIPTLSLPVHSPPPARVHSRRRGVSGDGGRGGGRRPGQFDSAFLAETVLIHVCVALKRATRLEGPLFRRFF